ncbi:hypothetical protein NPIL_645941 [Nephila pilipes]|uniref:Uncharacterized protein n=1 Tax=Nephila pilipes TaxID=299642 RepID=A0A8X6P9A5_NEPPI|nr:hypothetical protein NPIL_645941 [Nephila pilipes]
MVLIILPLLQVQERMIIIRLVSFPHVMDIRMIILSPSPKQKLILSVKNASCVYEMDDPQNIATSTSARKDVDEWIGALFPYEYKDNHIITFSYIRINLICNERLLVIKG